MRAGISAQNHHIVPVYQLGFVDVAEDCLDLGGRLAQDARRLLRTVVHETARDLATVGVEASDDLAALELTFDANHADGQQAFPLPRERASRAGVEGEPAGELHV